jgi:hypothetical protein
MRTHKIELSGGCIQLSEVTGSPIDHRLITVANFCYRRNEDQTVSIFNINVKILTVTFSDVRKDDDGTPANTAALITYLRSLL